MNVTVIGAGLAGCEAAWQLARRGLAVTLVEMKPKKMTPAHTSEDFAELVCSNSLRGAAQSAAFPQSSAASRPLTPPEEPCSAPGPRKGTPDASA